MLLVWMIEPLRFIWPWLRALPWPIQFGFVISVLGLLILMGSLIWERLEERVSRLEASSQSLDAERVALIDELEDLHQAQAKLDQDVRRSWTISGWRG